MQTEIIMHIITALTVLSYKLGLLIVGYLVTRMGYNLLIKGVTGEFKFKGEVAGHKADIASASPGIFFVFLGVVLLAVATVNKSHFETDYPNEGQSSGDKANAVVPPMSDNPLK